MKHAQKDSMFFRVITPSVAIEYELPIDIDEMTEEQVGQLAELEATAEKHGTAIQSGNYAIL